MCVGCVWRSRNVRASRSGSLASVAISHVLLACARGSVARVHLWISSSLFRIRLLNRFRVRVFGLIVMGVRLASLMAQPKRSLVRCELSSEEKKGGCRRLVVIRGRDGAAAASREWFRTQEIMMGKDAGASCESYVIMVAVMSVKCGGYDGVLLI